MPPAPTKVNDSRSAKWDGIGQVELDAVDQDILTNEIQMAIDEYFDPNLYAISVGKTRFSAELIRKSKVFAVNFMPYKLKEKALFCETHTGRHMDKFEETGLTKEESEKIDCPLIKEALAYMECEVVNEFETGDHIIFVGKIIDAKSRKAGKRLFQKDHTTFTTTVN